MLEMSTDVCHFLSSKGFGAEVVGNQAQSLFRRTLRRNVPGQASMDVGILIMARISSTNTPARFRLWPSYFANTTDCDCVAFVDERMFVACFNMKDFLLESANDTLKLGKQ